MMWLSAISTFFAELFSGIRTSRAAKAGAELPEGNGPWLPFGLGGALACLPFAVWLFLAIEQLPLAAEESHAPERDMPKGIIAGMFTNTLASSPASAGIAKTGRSRRASLSFMVVRFG